MTDSARRGEIHLGDLARALALLRWQDGGQAKAIAQCLGFGLREAPPQASTEIFDRQRYRQPASQPPEQPPRTPVFVPPSPEIPPALPEHTVVSALQPLTERVPPSPDPIDWLDETDALFDTAEEDAIVRLSLFHERTHRHLLAAALATRRTGAEIDVPRLIDVLCRREVMAALPCRPDTTLELGCQLLLDYSATMVPYWEDLTGLIGQVQHVIGADCSHVFSFDTQPTAAVQWTPEGEQVQWQPDGRPVLAATDFGIQGKTGRGTGTPAWVELIERCERRNSPLVILIPWPEHRWPLGLGKYPKLVHWSPHTSATMLRKMIGSGHKLD